MAEFLPKSGQAWAPQLSSEVAYPEPPPQSPLTAAVTGQRRTVRLFAIDNGFGLSRDSEIVAKVFRRAGWNVVTSDPRNPNEALPRVAVNVHLEHVAVNFFGTADRNVVIPNPEWWVSQWSPALARSSTETWVKSDDSVRIFSQFAGRVEKLGFCSRDQRDLFVARERTFLHIGGKSPNKGTVALVSAWRREWPRLTVVSSLPECAGAARANVTAVHRASDEELRVLQNKHAFHIYPSRYEGFGHAQWEGLSCGAIVFVTDGLIFSEYQDAFRFLSAKEGVLAQNRLVAWRDVQFESIEGAVSWTRTLSDKDLVLHQERARAAWESSVKAFVERADQLIARLDV